MSDKQIDGLTELTSVAPGDELPIYDISAGGEAKKITQDNLIPDSSDTVKGKVELATTAETTTGTDATRAVTPDGLHDMTSLSGAAWLKDEDDMISDSATTVPSQQSVKAYVDRALNTTLNINPLYAPQGFMINGKISVTDSGSGLVVALKTLAGADPSASDPVYVRIGDTVRTITAALSVTAADGTNWMNAGSAELATKEIDYFVYMGYNATDGVVIGFCRIPSFQQYSDFSVTSTSERYAKISTITNASTNDPYEIIGRFAATLSAGAGYTWTVPTFTPINLIQRPIYDTRVLSYTPTLTFTAGVAPTTPGNENNAYWTNGNKVYVRVSRIYSGNGTTVTRCDITLPFAGGGTVDQSPNGGGIFSNAFAPIATMNQHTSTAAQMFCASSTVNRVGFFMVYEI